MLRVLLFVLVLLRAAPGLAQDRIEPAHVYHPPDLVHLADIATGNPEDAAVFVLEHRYSVSLMPVIIWSWPYFWLAIVMVLLALIAWRGVRLFRRRSLERGERYCRRCLYNLRGVGDRCPECGVDVVHDDVIVRGTPVRARLIGLTLLAGILGLSALVPFAHRVRLIPYVALAYHLPLWRSPELASWLSSSNRDHWFHYARSYETWAVALGDSGRSPRRVVHYWPQYLEWMFYSSDSRRLYVEENYEAMAVVDSVSGRLLGTVRTDAEHRASQFLIPDKQEEHVAFLRTDGCLVHARLDPALKGLALWQPASPKLNGFPHVPVWGAWVDPDDRLWAGRDHERETITAWVGRDRVLKWNDQNGVLVWEIRLSGEMVDGASGSGSDEPLLYLLVDDRGTIELQVWDTFNGTQVEDVPLPAGMQPRTMAMSPGGRYLYVQDESQLEATIRIYDTEERLWLDRQLAMPGAQSFGRLVMAADGQTLLAVAWISGWEFALASFDLPQFRDPRPLDEEPSPQ